MPIEPSPSLALLDDPYSPAAREGIPVVTDLSYFHGKYYMYWGPATAAPLVLWHLLGGPPVGDEVVVFVATSCVFVSLTFTLLYVKKRLFPTLPHWLLALGIIVVATSHPMLWALNSPDVYVAAIASGQAFLVAGLYFALPVESPSERQPWRYALAGSMWVLALGSRITLVGGIVVLLAGMTWSAFCQPHRNGELKIGLTRALALWIPFLAGILLLALYNYTRFGDLLETGFRYQMNPGGNLGLQLAEGRVFSLTYLPPNLLYYLGAPVRWVSTFPFLRATYGSSPILSGFLGRFAIPSEYGIESAAGLLFTAPTLLFVAYQAKECLIELLAPSADAPRDTASADDREVHIAAIAGTVLVAGLCCLVPIMLYGYLSTRFLLDGMPLIAVVASIGAWQMQTHYRRWPIAGRLVNLLIVSTVVVALVVSLLLALSGAYSRLDDANPTLYRSLINIFSP